jgi:protein-S-isoprenylcysteine O-methyltransferase Ste14
MENILYNELTAREYDVDVRAVSEEITLVNNLSLIAFLILISLVAGRVLMLRRSGRNPFVFGKADKSEFILVPAVAFFVYAVLASVFSLPFPQVLLTDFFSNGILAWTGLIICFASLIWFALTLKAFGQSFRVGIDESTRDKLVVSGTFAISRNPLYLAILAFIAGMFLIHLNFVACIALVFFFVMINRQIRKEESFLRVHYGEEYEEYCRRVRRFF